jgi:glycosyltransferase involved in cell wall biosynthesis
VVPFPSPAAFDRPSDRFSDHPTDLVFFGKVETYKGLDTLARALEQLEGRDVHPSLRVVGPGSLAIAAPMLDRFAAEHPDRVFVHDEYAPAADIASALRSASVCVLPYLTAAGSSAIAVTGRHRVPLVASSAGSFGDFLTDGVDARLHRPGDAAALADDIAALLADDALRRGLGDALHGLQHTTFSADASTDRLLEALGPLERP